MVSEKRSLGTDTLISVARSIDNSEAALYDRQIRLWGVAAQNKLRNANVLLIGIGGLGCEVAKNLVLAGINSITVVDDSNSALSSSANFFVGNNSDADVSLAMASQKGIQILNPLVDVSVESMDKVKDEQFVKKFDLVCATSLSNEDAVDLNGIARANGVKFYCAVSCGEVGVWFADLGIHEFTEVTPVSSDSGPTDAVDDQEDGVEAKRRKVEAHVVDVEGDGSRTVKGEETYVALSDALKSRFWSALSGRKLRNLPSGWFAFMILQEFRKQSGSYPSTLDDIELLDKIASDLAKSTPGWPEVAKTIQSNSLVGEHSYVCSIVGGMLSQEVIKVLSGKDRPFNNVFVFNASENSSGTVLQVV